jgi:HlyD family secretion protein
MRSKLITRTLGVVVAGLVIVGLVGVLLRPDPVTVDLVTVERGALCLTVQDDGRTRIRERYVVSTPVAGRLVRIDLKPGDTVSAGESTLTVIEPTDPNLLDPRALAEARAREQAAQARLALLEPRQKLSDERLGHAREELERMQTLFAKQAVSRQEVDAAELAMDVAQAEHSETQFAREIADYELRLARAALIHTQSPPDYSDLEAFRFPILSPISGKVLRVMQESTTIVPAGAPLLELGDPSDLEVEVDVLSTDAVKVRPGARVILEHWGGQQNLEGKVRLIEPSAFTKVSALGIEEQRINVIIDFEHDQDVSVLGDGYRVEASIVTWEADDVLKVPIGALFRTGTDWAVFVNQNGVAKTQLVSIGHRNDMDAEVLDGLNEGQQVVIHPGDQLTEGSKLRARNL